MAHYIVTGGYSTAGIKGMVAQPSDREAAVRGLIEGAGGKVVSFLLTLGKHDFQIIVTTDDVQGMLAALMVAGASGGVSHLESTQAFTSAEFLAAQMRAQAMVPTYRPPA